MASDEEEAARKAISDALHQEFLKALEPHIRKAVSPDPPTVPDDPERRRPSIPLLYHYTTLDGLLGITSSSAIWASDVRYMNDASELTYAADLIASNVAEVLAEVTEEPLQSVLPTRPDFANYFAYSSSFGPRPFVACFCESDDLLSQWRGYSHGESGVSLGIDVHGVMRFDGPPNTYLRKVIYGQDEQRQAVREITTDWLSVAQAMIERGHEPKEVFPYPAIWGLQAALAEHHLCFKHPSFAEEQEWRIIKLVDVREEMSLQDHLRMEEQTRRSFERFREMGAEPPPPRSWNPYEKAEGVEIRFRRGTTGLVPYVEIPLRERAGIFTDRLPLWGVVQGPTPHPELAFDALTLCLQSRGYGFHTDVRPSSIPLRW